MLLDNPKKLIVPSSDRAKLTETLVCPFLHNPSRAESTPSLKLAQKLFHPLVRSLQNFHLLLQVHILLFQLEDFLSPSLSTRSQLHVLIVDEVSLVCHIADLVFLGLCTVDFLDCQQSLWSRGSKRAYLSELLELINLAGFWGCFGCLRQAVLGVRSRRMVYRRHSCLLRDSLAG